MKILVFLTFYAPHWTGLTAYAKRLSEGLAERGHTVTVVTSQHSPDLPLRDKLNGVDIIRLPAVARLSRGMVMPSFPTVTARLLAEHDIAQVHTPMLETAYVTGLAQMTGKPSIVTHHGDLVMPAGAFNQFVGVTVRSVMSLGLRLSDRVTVHSADYARNSDFLRPIAYKLDAIYPVVEIPQPQPDVIAAWKRELGLEGKKLIGFAGRFVEEKGFDYLLEAIKPTLDRVPNAHFVYAGETNVVYEHFFEKWKPLLDANSANVTTLGLLRDPQQLANFYGMLDLFALPSRTDCFPSVQIEALLSGAPIVATDIPGAREVVKVTGMGKLVRPGDPQALAEGFAEVLCNPAPYKPTREAVRAVFNTERSITAYEDLMKQLIYARRGAGQPVKTKSPELSADATRDNKTP